MASNQLLNKLIHLKRNPKLAEIIPQSEILSMLLELHGAFSALQRAVETNKIKGDDGYTPKAGVDYPSNQQIEHYLNSALQGLATEQKEVIAQLQARLATLKDGDDGKDAVITPELVRDIAELATSLIDLPDFDLLITTALTSNPEATRDGLELLEEENRLRIEAIRGLPEALKRLEELLNRKVADATGRGLGVGRSQVYRWIEQAVADGTIPVGGTGSTYETPVGAVDGVNVTYTVSAAPKSIIYFGSTLFEGPNGYSRSGLTITMPYAPTVADQFKAII